MKAAIEWALEIGLRAGLPSGDFERLVTDIQADVKRTAYAAIADPLDVASLHEVIDATRVEALKEAAAVCKRMADELEELAESSGDDQLNAVRCHHYAHAAERCCSEILGLLEPAIPRYAETVKETKR